jgi:Putative Flp pilus-assembly TadE/G-like
MPTLLKRERGQIVPMFALMLILLIGFMALVIDFGTIFASRRALQNAADAAALAGAKELETQMLGGSASPPTAAQTWAARNGVATPGATCPADGTPTITYNRPSATTANSWEVMTSRMVHLTFAPVVGINDICVQTKAVAVVTQAAEAKVFPYSLYGNVTLSPFAAPGTNQSCDPNQVTTDQYCFVLKEGAGGSSSGNFGILDFTCGGSQNKTSQYVYWVEHGYGSQPGEVIPGPIPPKTWTVCTFTGNTASGNSTIDSWIISNLQNPPPYCPKAFIDPGYVPDFRCPLIGLLPILSNSSLGTGSSGTVTIINFVVFEMVGLTMDQATGHQAIVGEFLQWAQATGPTYPQIPSGSMNGALTIRLVQ